MRSLGRADGSIRAVAGPARHEHRRGHGYRGGGIVLGLRHDPDVLGQAHERPALVALEHPSARAVRRLRDDRGGVSANLVESARRLFDDIVPGKLLRDLPEDGTHDGRTRAAASRVRARESATFRSFTFSCPRHTSAYPLRVSKSASTGRHPRRATPRRWIRKRHGRHERRRVDRIARRGDERDPRPAPTPRRRGSRTRDLRRAPGDARCARIGAGIGTTTGGGARVASLAPRRRARARRRRAPRALVARPDPARADTECTECSNSNSSLAPGTSPSSNPRRGRDSRTCARAPARRPSPARPSSSSGSGTPAGTRPRRSSPRARRTLRTRSSSAPARPSRRLTRRFRR